LTNKEYYLHCAVLSINSARPGGLAKYYQRSELPALITSQLKIKLIPEWQYGDS